MNRFGLQSATMVKTCVPVSQLELFINCNVHTYKNADGDSTEIKYCKKTDNKECDQRRAVTKGI